MDCRLYTFGESCRYDMGAGRSLLTRRDRHIWEAMRHVWPDVHWPGEQRWSGFDSRI
jgi:hypothetical protein